MAEAPKIIFLDIDGVLNTILTWGKRPLNESIDPERVQRIKNLCDETGAKIVISSTWRKLFSLEELKKMLDPLPVIDTTPSLNTGWRCDEIRFWLHTQPEIPLKFVIIDDDSTAAISKHFVYIAKSRGVEDSHIMIAKEILT